MKTCGLMLGYVPSTMSFKGITERLPHRESTVTVYRCFKKMAGEIIYPPPQHVRMIERLYRNIEAYPDIQKADSISLKEEPSQVRVNLNRDFKSSEIIIESYGKDISSETKAKLMEILLKNIGHHLFLNLGSFDVLWQRKRIIFFAGILPGEHFGTPLFSIPQ
jgi:hypothetical protein